MRAFSRLGVALTGSDSRQQAIISHGIKAGIVIWDTMPRSRYHATVFQTSMVFFMPKLLIYKGKMAKKITIEIMVLFGLSLGMPC